MSKLIKWGAGGGLIAALGVYMPLLLYGWYDVYILNNFDQKFGRDGSFWLGVEISSIIATVIFFSYICVFIILRKSILKLDKLRFAATTLFSGWLCVGFLFSGAWLWIVSNVSFFVVGHDVASLVASYFGFAFAICFLVTAIAGIINERINRKA